MQDVLIQRFHRHLAAHYPEFVVQLQEEGRLRLYLQEAAVSFATLFNELSDSGVPAPYAEYQCVDEWQKSLPPSKYDLLKELLAAELGGEYTALQQAGLLTTELINLISYCDPVFASIGFQEDDRYLRYLLIGWMHHYFELVNEVKDL